MKKILIIILSILHILIIADEKIIIMGYKDKEKLPLIGGEDNDSGLYKELFELAAKKIGFKLKIVRYPKKRIHKMLKEGEIDFYPGASFSLERAKYLYYLENGLKTKEVIVSKQNIPEIDNISNIKGFLLTELGSSKIEIPLKYPNLKLRTMNKLPMSTVIKALNNGRGGFYIADIEEIDYYKKINKIKHFSDLGIKIHYNAINKDFIPMYLGFSRNSSLYSETENKNFDSSKKISIDNFKSKISTQSIAYKFHLALQELLNDGETKKLYDKYFNQKEKKN